MLFPGNHRGAEAHSYIPMCLEDVVPGAASSPGACAQLSGVLHSEQLGREMVTVDLETLMEEVFVGKNQV